MRRSTAAAVGTLTGAALIIGVRLSVSAPVAPVAAPPAVDLAGQEDAADPAATATKKPSSKKPTAKPTEEPESDSGLKNGVFKGSAVKNPYGTIQVSIKISGGKISAADATYPVTGDSATINPPAIATLKQSTVKAQSADVDAVSGATFTSESYVKSLQAAIDQANA